MRSLRMTELAIEMGKQFTKVTPQSLETCVSAVASGCVHNWPEKEGTCLDTHRTEEVHTSGWKPSWKERLQILCGRPILLAVQVKGQMPQAEMMVDLAMLPTEYAEQAEQNTPAPCPQERGI